jgi:preprotein translocase subunit SecF
MSRLGAIGGRLYRGEVSFDFVSRKKLWYTISGLILVISIAALAFRGLNYSVEFKGGNLFLFKAPHTTSAQISNAVKSAGGGDGATVTQLGLGSKAQWQVQTDKLSFVEQTKLQNVLANTFHVSGGASQVSITFTSASWGSQITHKAFEGLIVFLILIVIYLSIAFEWQMALAAFVALIHDIVITIGVYALAGFQVSPATVIGLLTILGYSLYDTVVVFDKVRENTAGLLATGRSTYSQAANLALNQTLVRSINTSLIALLPVTAILVVAVAYLGTGAVRRHALRHVLLNLHRHTGARQPEGAPAEVQAASAPRRAARIRRPRGPARPGEGREGGPGFGRRAGRRCRSRRRRDWARRRRPVDRRRAGRRAGRRPGRRVRRGHGRRQ